MGVCIFLSGVCLVGKEMGGLVRSEVISRRERNGRERGGCNDGGDDGGFSEAS